MQLEQSDLLAIGLRPLDRWLSAYLSAHGATPPLVEATIEILHATEMCALVASLAAGLGALQGALRTSANREHVWRYALRATSTSVALAAIFLFAWVLRRPSANIGLLIGRFDHLVLCACGGYALSGAPAAVRAWLLGLGSLAIIGQHIGWEPTRIIIGGAILGMAALHMPALRGRWVTAASQGLVLAGTFCMVWRLRATNPLMALSAHGLFAFVLLRHISFVVETRRGKPAGPRNYLCYILFYPCCIGASELYDEFHDRNLNGSGSYDNWRAVRYVVAGRLQIWLALLLPVSFEATMRIGHPPTLWVHVLVLFVRSSLFLMGLWALIRACGLLYGVELRPNFAGILWCKNPSEFWRAWRGTMTHWLTQYIYIPLGGNRRSQARNILAAFAVSALWHCMGQPFLGHHTTTWTFTPMMLWGALNALGVIGYAFVHRRGWQILPPRIPEAARLGTKVFLTACYGTLTVTVLGIGPDMTDVLLPFLQSLMGIRGW
jgi:hypothetical protein